MFPPSVIGVDPNLKVASNNENNFSIQRELGWKTALEVRYVGAFSHNSTRIVNFDQINLINTGFLADFLRAQNDLALNAAQRNALIAAGRELHSTARFSSTMRPVRSGTRRAMPSMVRVTSTSTLRCSRQFG